MITITDQETEISDIEPPEREVLIPRQFLVLFLNPKDKELMDAIAKKNEPEYIMRMCYMMSVESLHEARVQRGLLEEMLKELKLLRAGLGRQIKAMPKNEYERSISN